MMPQLMENETKSKSTNIKLKPQPSQFIFGKIEEQTFQRKEQKRNMKKLMRSDPVQAKMLKDMENQKKLNETQSNTIENALMNDYEELKGEKALVDQDNIEL